MATTTLAPVGVLVVSHVPPLATGVKTLIQQVAADVPLAACGGTAAGDIGTDFAAINAAVSALPAQTVWAFYDLGSAKMNLQLVAEMNAKPVKIWDTPLVEGAYTAASLLQAAAPQATIAAQLAALTITK